MCVFLNNNISQNLIQNGSFEYYGINPGASGCVTSFDSLKYWKVANNSPDVYVTSCMFANHYGIPNNCAGASYPVNGNAYAGAILFSNIGAKEYFYQHLLAPLQADSIYCMSFFVSRADKITHALKQIGAYFSSSLPPPITGTGYIDAVPQVVNTNGFIVDTIGWTEIQGCFMAQGGEQYITIGNFNSNANTDTLFVGSTNPVPYADGYGYYYFDSISLWKNNLPTRLNDIKKIDNLTLYPNPTNGIIKIFCNSNNKKDLQIKINDLVGKEVKALDFQEEIIVSDLEQGVYFLSIYQNHQLVRTQKILKE